MIFDLEILLRQSFIGLFISSKWAFLLLITWNKKRWPCASPNIYFFKGETEKVENFQDTPKKYRDKSWENKQDFRFILQPEFSFDRCFGNRSEAARNTDRKKTREKSIIDIINLNPPTHKKQRPATGILPSPDTCSFCLLQT